MLAYTNIARQSHINNITKLIDKLGTMKNGELNYIEYREIVNYLSTMRDLYRKEMTGGN